MVKNEKQHIEKTRAKQGCPADSPEPYKIAASTSFDFGAKNLTPYGGLFPVATMLEKLDFKKLVEEILTIHRIPRAMTIYQFLLGMVLAIYVGFSRLNHLRFLAQDPMLTGVLQVGELPPQCTFWRFLTSIPVTVAQQLLKLQRLLRERVWEAANVHLPSITLDTDTTVHTLYGDSDLYRRDSGIYRRRVAQRRPAQRCADRTPSRGRFCRRPPLRVQNFRAGRCGVLLLGGRRSLREGEGFLHHRGTQDPAFARRAQKGRLEALAEDRCG